MSNEQRTDVSYLVIITDSVDEAESLSAYFNEHGVAALHTDGIEVNCPVIDTDDMLKISKVKASWRIFFDHSDHGVLGLNLSLFEVPN